MAEGGGQFVPQYFDRIPSRLGQLQVAHGQPPTTNSQLFVSGGTDLYVQRHDAMTESEATHLFYDDELRTIRDAGEYVEIGASVTVTDLLESPVMNAIFPDLYKHLKLVSSTPIRNMATLAGNFVNASPIGDMTVWFLAMDAEIELCTSPRVSKGDSEVSSVSPLLTRGLPQHGAEIRMIPLRDLYLGYKQLAKTPDEMITAIRFRKPAGDHRFNFEKVCKRTYLDIASVNTAISLTVRSTPGEGWMPPALSVPPAVAGGAVPSQGVDHTIIAAHVAAGGVAPIPLYLQKTSEFLVGKTVNAETITAANEIMQSEISPISDVRGTESYKRLLLRQLFRAHFVENWKLFR